MMKRATVVARVDDVIVRRHCDDAGQAMALFNAFQRLHCHWVLVRDRTTGGTFSLRAP